MQSWAEIQSGLAPSRLQTPTHWEADVPAGAFSTVPSARGHGGLEGSLPRLGWLRARPWVAGLKSEKSQRSRRSLRSSRHEGVVAERTLPRA